jgi:phosphoribosylformylglycinamidine cyclo-ligase
MYNTFNMGIGMVICVSANDVAAAVESLQATGEETVMLGKIVEGKGVVFA